MQAFPKRFSAQNIVSSDEASAKVNLILRASVNTNPSPYTSIGMQILSCFLELRLLPE